MEGGSSTPNSPALDIIYEGAGLLILNKPSGLAVHGKGSLDEQVRAYLLPKLPPSLSFRPGPLHRLDKPSSGIVVFSANLEGAQTFSRLMRERMLKKFYLALVEGAVEKAETWQGLLVRDSRQKKTFAKPPERNAGESSGEAKTAITRIRPLAGNVAATLILAEIETGRTHQIRAQAAARGHPLLGDKKYGGKNLKGGFLLHAWRMEFPQGTVFPRQIEAPLPGYFREKIRRLFGEDSLGIFEV
jgi:23S rRNA pseudouridine955/2504/2580 synthase